MSARHRATASLGAILCFCTAIAQRPEETVLKVTSRLVQVSVVAHDRNGKIVRDLTRDDFTLTDNGQPQPISVFSVKWRNLLKVRLIRRIRRIRWSFPIALYETPQNQSP